MSRSPPVLEGAKAHYRRAEAYESRYAPRTEDVRHYLRRCSSADSVLEYGSGGGRLTLPLARSGLRVTATDVSEPMIALLRQRLAREPSAVRRRVKARVADCRTFRTKSRFDIVLAGFHTVSHMYNHSDMSAFLQHGFRHLRQGGRILFDVPLPHVDIAGYDALAQVAVTEVDADAGPELLTQRYFFPRELEMHLHYAGFQRVQIWADYSAQEPGPASDVLVVSASKPRGAT